MSCEAVIIVLTSNAGKNNALYREWCSNLSGFPQSTQEEIRLTESIHSIGVDGSLQYRA